MKVAVVGSRDFPFLNRVWDYIYQLPLDTIIISGGARGVDRTAAKAARTRGMQVIEFLADWERNGRGAGMIRNETIVRECDELIAFWDGVSSGTRNSIERARKAGKPVEIITHD
jgi:hypothetical protein